MLSKNFQISEYLINFQISKYLTKNFQISEYLIQKRQNHGDWKLASKVSTYIRLDMSIIFKCSDEIDKIYSKASKTEFNLLESSCLVACLISSVTNHELIKKHTSFADNPINIQSTDESDNRAGSLDENIQS